MTALPGVTPEAFESGRIDPDGFDHDAHVYLAWQYVRRFPLATAVARFTAGLEALTRQLGVPDKYHATITWFFLLLIADRHSRRPDTDWAGFRRSNPDILDAGETLARHYRRSTIASERARRNFLLPDKAA